MFFLSKKNKTPEEPEPVPETPAEPEVLDEAIPPVILESAPEIAEPNEAFFGTLLIGCLVLSGIATAGYFGYAGYRYFQSVKTEQSIPSIAGLPQVEKEAVSDQAPAETSNESGGAVPTPDKKTIVIKVLNGGAAKGVAGSYGDKLKQAGFEQATIGNTSGSYTGATLYHAEDQESALPVLQEVILKDYPALVTKKAETANKDTTAAPLTLILGR